MVTLTAEQISRVFELGHRITDATDAKLFYDALAGDYNAKGNFALRAVHDKSNLESPRVKALLFLRDLDTQHNEAAAMQERVNAAVTD
jgi:hypothetical protein